MQNVHIDPNIISVPNIMLPNINLIYVCIEVHEFKTFDRKKQKLKTFHLIRGQSSSYPYMGPEPEALL